MQPRLLDLQFHFKMFFYLLLKTTHVEMIDDLVKEMQV